MLNDRAKEILEEQKQVLDNKGKDYQNPNSSITDADYYKWDKVPGMTMMQTKLLRYASVIEGGNNPNHEGATDSLRDLINYAARTLAYLETQEGKTNMTNNTSNIIVALNTALDLIKAGNPELAVVSILVAKDLAEEQEANS